ncbi:ribosome silencing factor [Eubacterium aggregans]|uniref:ribosome silencing factor n=1 Tax=Eubacterium aggregans TaxID=81409 RepID=UPI003F3203E1
MEPKELVPSIKEWMNAKNATDIEIIDIQGISSLADYFIIASGNSERQVQAIADNVEFEAKKCGVTPKNIEGEREARWILMDYYDVIVHIFHAKEREFYDLERLWKDGIRPNQKTD